jgi:formate hydrogenlyase subunit 3/multisubunit Na+/H+ antiporter MnhD subunit
MQHIFNAFIFCIHLMDVKLHYFSNKINPTLLLGRLPCVKRRFEKKGQNYMDEYNKVFTDKTSGLSIIVSLGIAGGLIFGILISSFIIVSKVFNFYEYVPGFYFVLFCGISILISYFISWRRNKYLDYFEKFEKWTRSQKRKYVLISFFTIIATIAYFFISLMCC